MAFDPNYPPTNAPLISAQFRTQFTGLKALIDERVTQNDMEVYVSNAAIGKFAIDPLALTVSNPPTQAQMQAVVDKLNELIGQMTGI